MSIVVHERATITGKYSLSSERCPGQRSLLAVFRGMLDSEIAPCVVGLALHCPEELIIATVMVPEHLGATLDLRSEELKRLFLSFGVFESVEVSMVSLDS